MKLCQTQLLRICRDVTHFKLKNYEYNQDKVKINSMIIIHDNIGIARICL